MAQVLTNGTLTRVVAVVSVVTSIVVVAAAHYSQVSRIDVLDAQTKRLQQQIISVEQRSAADHDILVELRNDVRHIKSAIDGQAKRGQP